MLTVSYKWNHIKANYVGSITGDCELCQDEISALTTRVNVVILHCFRVVITPLTQCKNHPHLDELFMQKSFIFVQKNNAAEIDLT